MDSMKRAFSTMEAIDEAMAAAVDLPTIKVIVPRSKAEAAEHIMLMLTHKLGGCTRTEGKGTWIDGDTLGEDEIFIIVEEEVFIFEASHPDELLLSTMLNHCALQLRLCGEKAMYAVKPNGKAIIVALDF